ncbi:hypothetical protein TDIS_1173 [Thermosulfurimonas dismutans]|uniref:Uncharacterized protein n=1 Tax=Thermosulfurimonas dismutans TaxID=999894 RepID=A0A179D3S7_9BACT|nr:hypothetical protein TDIS_1173 [Thermosulfurimonas dismutans]
MIATSFKPGDREEKSGALTLKSTEKFLMFLVTVLEQFLPFLKD